MICYTIYNLYQLIICFYVYIKLLNLCMLYSIYNRAGDGVTMTCDQGEMFNGDVGECVRYLYTYSYAFFSIVIKIHWQVYLHENCLVKIFERNHSTVPSDGYISMKAYNCSVNRLVTDLDCCITHKHSTLMMYRIHFTFNVFYYMYFQFLSFTVSYYWHPNP